MRHLRLQQGVRLRQPEDVPAAVLGRGHAVSDPGVHGGAALLRLRVQDLEEGDAALAAASGSDLLSVAGDVPEDLLHDGEALPGAADRRERGCGEHPAEVLVLQPQVPDRADHGRGGRRHGGSDKGIRRGDAEQRKREDEGGGHRPVQQGAEEGDHPSQGERHPSGERRGGADRRPAFSEQPQAEIEEGAGAGETLHGRSCFTAAAFRRDPLILVSALLVYMEDRENPFFTQERLTKGGEKFQIYKLRTMKAGSEKEIGLAKKEDARITKVGKVLRKYRIDELPQLVNVVKGEMSLIGPRPEREYYYRLYDKTMPEFRYRLNVKAGLSGYAQVWGRYNTKLREKLMMDLMYIQDYSFLLDIKLMLETVRVVFDRRSSEGVEE